MRILIITSKFPRFARDAQPPFVFYFAKELVKLGHEVFAVAPHDKGAKTEEVLEGVKIFRFRYFPEAWQKLSYGPGIPTNITKSLFSAIQMPFFILSEIMKSWSVARKVKADIVHAHWGFPQGLAARFTGLPYVINFYGGELFMARKFKLMWLINFAVNGSCRSFTVTKYYVDIMKDYGIKKPIGAIPLGVDVKTFYPNVKGWKEVRNKFCGKDELMVLFVGRLVERKGPNYLVEAFRKVAAAVPKAKLVVVGGGPMESALKQQAEELGIQGKVIFTGEITNTELPKYYCAADIFVLPSIIDRHGDREGQGVVYLEAMACKTPVIGTESGGIPDVIKEGTGLMVKVEKSGLVYAPNPGQLADTIIKLLKSSKLRKSMGEKAYKHVLNRFTWEKIAQQYVEVFRDCLMSEFSNQKGKKDRENSDHVQKPHYSKVKSRVHQFKTGGF